MRTPTIAGLCFSFFAAAAWSQPEVKVGLEPSPLEAFAKTRGVRTVWSNRSRISTIKVRVPWSQRW